MSVPARARRVLFLSRNLPPLVGGMERLNLQIARALADGAAVHVVGPSGCAASLPPGVSVDEVPLRPLPRFLVASFARAVSIARRERPSLVIAGSGLTAVAAVVAARIARCPSVIYVHGLDLVTRDPVYRLLWLPALRRATLALANSRNTADIARRAGVASGNVAVLHPAVDLPQAPPPARAHGPTLLSVGRLTERKGLVEFVERALPDIAKAVPDVMLHVIGAEASEALHGSRAGMRERIEAAARAAGVERHLRMRGACSESELQDAYANADVHVFPVRDLPGDVEGFGMVAIEAAAHGLPTVAFAVGGVPDAVLAPHNGQLVSAGDYAGFARTTLALLETRGDAAARAEARDFAARFAFPRFAERLHSLLENPDAGRSTHAVLGLESRVAKARKIEALLGLPADGRRRRLLEIGTGSGGIAHWFATQRAEAFEVAAVDVADVRTIREGYAFQTFDGATLPFADASFDVVLSNHVIEHVGDRAAQRRHLAELRRVLRADGVGYLAVPSRWQVVEPHYRLAFLSWLPETWRTAYLRFRRRGREYDCLPPRPIEMEALLAQGGFDFTQQAGNALRLTYAIERPRSFVARRVLPWLGDGAMHVLRRAFPTLIYVLRPARR